MSINDLHTKEHFSKKFLNYFPTWELSSRDLNFFATAIFILTILSYSFLFFEAVSCSC